MTKTLIYIGTIADLIQSLKITQPEVQKWICISMDNSANHIDNVITQMKENNYMMKLSCLLYFSPFSIKFYNKGTIIYYHFNNNNIYHTFYSMLQKENIETAIIDRNFHLEEQFIENLTKRNIKIIFM